MFYSTHMLGRKGPLAVIWIAAHKDPKFLKRNFVDDTSVSDVCRKLRIPQLRIVCTQSPLHANPSYAEQEKDDVLCIEA